ncbi:O-antigen/teichoic acid export membrane protein [Halanaerobium saccharolyticum]|uniref:O-antigen/teichoic acid export membrane protein n=1 Tax=Halanaerobium saccharolyticum TaxID=43595 RepID=A0A4R6R8E8_9FIRM|nr:polysaccharide biosynthesis C-terminal domain-containing protein [Halanaerobium saccharolyticum]TDP82300.1 O-antigen/teichoic acid export membrane protein [Halanaerobium saccharolyticum]
MNNKYGFNLIIRIMTKIILHVRSLVFLPIITKNFDASTYGIWTQVNILITLMVPLLIFKLDISNIRYLASKPKDKSFNISYFSNLFFILILFIPLLLIIFSYKGFFSELIFNSNNLFLLYVFMILLLIKTIYLYLLNYYKIVNRIDKYSLIEVFTSIFSILSGGIVVVLWKNIIGIFITFIIVELISIIYIFIDIIKEIGLPIKFDFTIVKKFLAYSVPLMPNAILFWIINYSDRIFILKLLGKDQLGFYSASYSIGQLSIFFITPISFVLFPIISNLWENNEIELVKKYIQKSIYYYMFFSIPSIFGLYVLSSDLLIFLADETYVTDGNLIMFIILGFFSVGFFKIFVNILYLKEKTKSLPIVYLFVSLINLFLNYIFIPKFGIEGAAIATFISFGLQGIIIYFLTNKLLKIDLNYAYYFKIIFSSLVMFFMINMFNPNSFSSIVFIVFIGLGTYLLLLWILNGFYDDFNIYKNKLLEIINF